MDLKPLSIRVFFFLLCYFSLNVGLQYGPFTRGLTQVYSHIQEPIFNALHSEISATFDYQLRDNSENQDLRIDGFHTQKKFEYTIYLDIRTIVFLPLFLFFSLIVVSPISIRRKIIGGIVGLLFFCVLISAYYSHDLLTLFAESQYIPSTLYERFSKYMRKAWYSEGYLLLMLALWILVLLFPNPFKKEELTTEIGSNE